MWKLRCFGFAVQQADNGKASQLRTNAIRLRAKHGELTEGTWSIADEIRQEDYRGGLQLLSSGSLSAEKECLGIFSFAANLERSEVLIPGAFGRVRLRLTPYLQLVQIIHGNLPLG